MTDSRRAQAARRWGELRYAVIGSLLAAPPEPGALQAELETLAVKEWRHPIHGRPVVFGVSTIERWYYVGRNATDPVGALTSRPRSDRGRRKALGERLLAALRDQYARYPAWTVTLHRINLLALVREDPKTYGVAPSYSTVLRTMRHHGWDRRPRAKTPGQHRAADRLAQREVRSFEVTHNHALWHYDFHHGSLRVVDTSGTWHTPKLLGFIDDRSRVVPHAQWYLAEDTERLAHGLSQAILKRGLPRGVVRDNGPAMRAAEIEQGLKDLGINDSPTLPYSPYQNGKKETFWGVVESRLLAMLERVERLDLAMLNRCTLAWIEGEYHREIHDSLGVTPLDRLAEGPTVVRAAPTLERLRFTFTQVLERTVRRSDGTVQIDAVRFEIPSRLRTLRKVTLRYRRWDLSEAWVIDPRTNDVLARIEPVDLTRNADRRRKPLAVPDPTSVPVTPDEPLPPRMRELLADFAADGLPPPFLPLDDDPES